MQCQLIGEPIKQSAKLIGQPFASAGKPALRIALGGHGAPLGPGSARSKFPVLPRAHERHAPPPAAGNKELVKRITLAAPLLSLRITWAFVSKAYARSPAAARELFFSADLPPADLDR